jgi:hypothetical protein
MMKTQTLEQWIDKNAPKWVQNAYVKQTREFIDRLEAAEDPNRLVHEGDTVVEGENEPGTNQVVGTEGGFPVPQIVKNDPEAVEILRVWKHGNGSCSHVSATYQLEGPWDWGACLGIIAVNLIDGAQKTEPPDYNRIVMLAVLARAFLDNLGVQVAVISPVQSGDQLSEDEDDPADGDPDNLLN